GWQRAAAIACLVFDSIPAVGIVTCGNYDSAGGGTATHEIGNSRRRTRPICQPDRSACRGDNFRQTPCDPVGRIAMVITNNYTLSRVFSAHDVARNRLRNNPCVREREVLGNDAAPAVGAELDRAHFNQPCEYMLGREKETAALAGEDAGRI